VLGVLLSFVRAEGLLFAQEKSAKILSWFQKRVLFARLFPTDTTHDGGDPRLPHGAEISRLQAGVPETTGRLAHNQHL
jgi:hypothetical protein